MNDKELIAHLYKCIEEQKILIQTLYLQIKKPAQ
jgi:hypothetical protein